MNIFRILEAVHLGGGLTARGRRLADTHVIRSGLVASCVGADPDSQDAHIKQRVRHLVQIAVSLSGGVRDTVSSQSYIVYLMLVDYKPTHDPGQDTFKVEYLLGGAAVLGILLPQKYIITEMLWAFSIWLESVAILPQLFMLQRTGEAETITTHYLFALGAYRALYIPNWIYRWFLGNSLDGIAVIAGIVQTVLYSDFFYIYWTKYVSGKHAAPPEMLYWYASIPFANAFLLAECSKARNSTFPSKRSASTALERIRCPHRLLQIGATKLLHHRRAHLRPVIHESSCASLRWTCLVAKHEDGSITGNFCTHVEGLQLESVDVAPFDCVGPQAMFAACAPKENPLPKYRARRWSDRDCRVFSCLSSRHDLDALPFPALESAKLTTSPSGTPTRPAKSHVTVTTCPASCLTSTSSSHHRDDHHITALAIRSSLAG
nr:er lumen protein-retaining receptor [Quercus suber]